MKHFKKASHNKVFIAGITWNNGGGHWVVVVAEDGADLAVLDVGYGHQKGTIFPHYTPTSAGIIQARGQFDGYIMEITT